MQINFSFSNCLLDYLERDLLDIDLDPIAAKLEEEKKDIKQLELITKCLNELTYDEMSRFARELSRSRRPRKKIIA